MNAKFEGAVQGATSAVSVEDGKTVRLGGLDGLRGIAVLMVILFHAQRLLAPGSDFVNLIDGGWFGVDLFFVVSGFLITGILRRTRDHPRYWMTFALRRVLRIFPLYYLILVLTLVPRLIAGVFEGPPFWVYPTFVSNFWIATEGGNDLTLDITWSLSIEEQFYLLWPVVVLYGNRRRLVGICVLLIITAPIVRLVLHDPTNEISYMWTPARMDSLAWGALAAIAWELRSEWWSTLAGRLAPWGAFGIVLILATMGDVRSSKLYAVVGLSVFPAVVAAIVLGLASGRLESWKRVLDWAPLAHLGKVSYGAYLLHGPIIIALSKTPLLGHRWIGMVAVAALTWGAATLVWRTLEAPILAKKESLAPY